MVSLQNLSPNNELKNSNSQENLQKKSLTSNNLSFDFGSRMAERKQRQISESNSPQKPKKSRFNSRNYTTIKKVLQTKSELLNEDPNKKLSKEEQELGISYLDQGFNKYYTEIANLGNGCQAVVKKVMRIKDSKYFAVKIVRLTGEEQLFHLKYEFTHLKKIPPHKNIVQMYEMLIDEEH